MPPWVLVCASRNCSHPKVRESSLRIYTGMPSYLDSGGKSSPFRHDVKSQTGWHDLILFVGVNLGGLDILINNAGINLLGGVMDTTLEQWRETLAVNTDRVFLGCQHAIGLMQKSGGGSIVNITAAAAVRPGSGQIAYTTSNAAVISMTQSIALWCAQHGAASVATRSRPAPFVRRSRHISLIGSRINIDSSGDTARPIRLRDTRFPGVQVTT